MGNSLYIEVRKCVTPVSDEEAARQYGLLRDVESERRFDAEVYAFYSRLIKPLPRENP